MNCVICNKERTLRKADFKLKILEGLNLGCWVYSCMCPAYLLHELDFIIKKKVNFSKIKELFKHWSNKKRDWIYANDSNLEIGNSKFEHTIRYINYVRGLKKELQVRYMITDFQLETLNINKNLWKILYTE